EGGGPDRDPPQARRYRNQFFTNFFRVFLSVNPPNTLPSLSAATPSGMLGFGPSSVMKAVTLPSLTLPIRIGIEFLARLGIGGVENVVAVDVEAARPAELPPFGEKFSILVEDLDAVVRAVGDEQPPARIH